jgi:hypothetical protein
VSRRLDAVTVSAINVSISGENIRTPSNLLHGRVNPISIAIAPPLTKKTSGNENNQVNKSPTAAAALSL